MSNAVAEFLSSDIQIPSPPLIAIRILEAVKKDNESFDELSKIISSDPALAAKILMVANSSFYTIPQKIDSIPKALSILGTNTLKNIALSFVIAKGLRGPAEGGFDFDLFWKRALTAAVATDMLSPIIPATSEDIFVTALLQDIGIVILYLCRNGDYLKVFDEKRASSLVVEEVEKMVFGFDHQDLGAEVLKNWGIPKTIYEPIRHHHAYENAPEEIKNVSQILLLSDKMSSVYHGTRSAEKIKDINTILCKDHEINEADVGALIDSVADKSVEMFSFFEIEPGDMKPFSQILQEANEELGRLNLSYEQLTVELKQAKERAEKYAQELKSANETLREFAFRDGLTGLYNHRYFQDTMDRELGRVMRYKNPLSLIMIDIDHFKMINDEYGHPVGDIVLKAVSRSIQSTLRDCDIAVRYGGEEFAVILPETELQGALIVAERLRKVVAETPIETNAHSIQVTISLGVTCCMAATEKKAKADMIAQADHALYNSKRNGRNQSTAFDKF